MRVFLFRIGKMKNKLRVPCAYQGGKQRVAPQIVEELIEAGSAKSLFYDFCCGSGAISTELVNRGIDPSRIVMLDISSWAVFWRAIGAGTFDIQVFDNFLLEIPSDKRRVKSYMLDLAAQPVGSHEAELYPILQSASFGGKQIWREESGSKWVNAFFRDYWEPTPTSVRRSPANPMQPSPDELRRRVIMLAKQMKGLTCEKANILTTLDWEIPDDSVVYIDPPYNNTTGYAFEFDIDNFIERFTNIHKTKLFVSEGKQLSENATRLVFGGAKGGINGSRIGKHQEWINRFF